MGETIFEMPLWEILARGTLIYFTLAMVFRVMPKRLTGEFVPMDMITLVIVGTLASYSIMGDTTALPDLLVMIGVMLFWDYMFDVFEFYFVKFRRVSEHSPTLLIHNGDLLRNNLRKEKLTEDELSSNLRKHGFTDMDQVKQAILEPDGSISVIGKE